jgi:PPIC-type PPIASE domain
MRRLLQEPLLHFLILGALLFGLFSRLQANAPKAPDEIVLSRGQVQSLQAQFQRTRQRPPTAEELQGLVESWVREEIFYREGLAMGLDRDDPIVRRRVAQKLEFIADGATPTPPTAAELQAWLETHADKYQIEARYTLTQVYFDVARHGEKLDADVAAVRRALDAGKTPAGDSTLLPPALDKAEASEVKRVFGKEFAEALKGLPVGAWQGPLRSGFGVHLVKLSASEPGRRATLDEVRAEVERDLLHARTAQANTAHYEKLRARYTVRTDPTVTAAH